MKDQIILFFNKYKSFGKELSINSIYKFLTTFLMMISSIIMTRNLLEANRGLYQLYITSLVMFNILLNLGLNGSATYYAKKEPDKLNQYISLNIIISIISSIIIALVIVLSSDYVNFQSTSIRNTFLICYLFFSFTQIFTSFLVGTGQLKFQQKTTFYVKLLFFIYVVVLHISNQTTVLNLTYFLLVEYFLYSTIFYKKLKLKVFPLKIEKTFLKESLNLNLKVYILSLFGFLLLRSDIYFLKFFKGNFNVGIYAIGSTIVEQLGLVTIMFNSMMLPKLIGDSNYINKLKKIKKGLLFIIFLSIIFAIVIYFIAPFLILLYYKKENVLAISSLRILMIGFVFISMQGYLNTLYLSQRVKKTQISIYFFCLILSVILNYIYIPKYDFLACAWVSVLCYAILFFSSFFDLFYLKKRNWIKKLEDGK